MSVKVNDRVKIQSFKHNGYIHRVWDNARVMDINKDRIVVCTSKSRVYESTGRSWHTKEPAILLFYFNDWHNTIAMFREDGIYYYTNLSSPCVIDNGMIKYIDYDIDIKTNKDIDYRILDENEFHCHKYSMNYPLKIEKILYDTLDQLISKFKSKSEPYCNELVSEFYKKSLL